MNNSCRILIVDDDPLFREMMARQLEHLDYQCTLAEGGESALTVLSGNGFDVAFIDLAMPDMDGMTLLGKMEEAGFETVPVVMTGGGNIASAVEAMKHGAFDYIEKTPDIDLLQSTVERAVNHRCVKRQARKMSQAATQWEATFNTVPDLIAIIDNDHRFVRINQALADKLRCTPKDAVGKICYEVVHGLEEPPKCCPHTLLMKNKQRQFTSYVEEHLGGHYLASISPLHDAEGTLMGSVHVARDITEAKEAEEQLHKAHMEMARLVDSMSSFLVEADMTLSIRRWNKAAELTFGLPASEVLGKSLVASGMPFDWKKIAGDFTAWLSATDAIRLPEIRYMRPDESEGIMGIMVNPIIDDAGEKAGFFLTGTDITERKTLEAQLVQAQKLESIGQLAAGIAHEINTPTQYVGDNLEFLQIGFEQFEGLFAAYDKLLQNAKAGAVTDELINEVETAVEDANFEYLAKQIPRATEQSIEGVGRIASIVKAMKEFSHPGAEEKTQIDLNHSIESTITVSRNEWKYVADVETDFDEMLPNVPCLPGEFNQVILNMLVNAAHAIGDVLESGSEEKGKISVSTRCDGEWAEIRIGDSGTGIPEKARTHIFDPFYTTKEVGRGTGQGLAISHNVIVEKHGGTLNFETEMGKGTTFIIRIPISGEQ